MHEFDYESSPTLTMALTRIGPTRQVLAGGTDLMTRLKLGLDTPEAVVDIKSSGLDADIRRTEDGIRLGALCTLSDIRHCTVDDAGLQLLSQAARQAATRQIRNRATIAGNLLQSPRCWYYRHPDVECWRKGGEHCPAREGRNAHHAVVDQSPCVTVHPSDLSACLLALDAELEIRSADGERRVSVGDFLQPPNAAQRSETRLDDGEIVTGLRLPDMNATARSRYLKAMDRKTWAFALAGVAAVVTMSDDRVTDVRLSLTGVANVPIRLSRIETLLLDQSPTESLIEQAVAQCTEGFTPLSENAYKLELLRGLMRQVLQELLMSEVNSK